MYKKARIYEIHAHPKPHALFLIGEHDGKPILAKVLLGYGDLYGQAHTLAEHMPMAFFIAHAVEG
jgi:hypothetical protein